MTSEVCRTPISFGELLARPGVVEELELGGPVGFCAFHGGNLERRTEHIAREAARRSGASYYGVIQPDGMRHHIPSARINPAQSERFTRFLAHTSTVIAIHGFGRQNLFTTVLCGGANRPLAAHIGQALRRALPAYRIADAIEEIPKPLRGLHPDNPCNWPAGGGAQIELPPRIRGVSPLAHWWPSAGADNRFPHTEDLIDGLAAAAESWPSVAAQR